MVTALPEFGQQIHDLLCIVRLDRSTVCAHATFVIGDDSSQTKHESLRQFALALQIGLQTRQVACLEFRERVEHDTCHGVIYVRVVETLQHTLAVGFQFLLRQVERLQQFVEHHFVDVLTQHLMVACIANDVDAAEVGDRTEHGVRTVQQRHFALVIRFLALGDEDVQSGFVSRELGFQFFDRHVLRFLDHPEVEDLGLHHEVVVVTHFLLDSRDVFAREARYDTVHEGSAYIVVFLKPLFETGIVCTEIIFPELDILADTILEVVSVEEDQLTRHEDKTFGRVAVEGLVATEQQLHQFAGISRSRCVCEFASRVECDTCLRGVGDDKTDLRLLCQCHVCPVLGIGVQGTTDNIDTLQRVDRLTFQTTLQVHMIQAVLTVEPLHHTFVNRLNHNHRTVEIGLGIHVPYNPIYECAEEVAFTKLDDSFGSHTLRSSPLVQSFFHTNIFF